MFTEISEREYERMDPSNRIIVHDHPRKFGSLSLPGVDQVLTLCWRSNLLEPTISINPFSGAVWVGIDQRIICLAPQGNALFSIGLISSFLNIKHFEECTIISCETQAMVVNRDYSLRRICDLREIPEEINFGNGKMVVTFMDAGKEEYSL
jgi:hypothetical protein